MKQLNQQIFLFILITFIANFAFAGSVECSNSNGSFKYTEESYEGGAPPPPKMVIRTEEWFKNNELIGKAEYLSRGTSRVTGVLGSFDSNSYVELENRNDGYVRTIVYATRAGIPNQIAMQFVVCTSTRSAIPLP